jgi:hypothetical protein
MVRGRRNLMASNERGDAIHAGQRRSGIREKAVDVIVVEDDADALLTMGALLTANGCVVRAVASADAAHEAALERVPRRSAKSRARGWWRSSR